ncbi:MAG TPA: KEOPS complex kinase/ATPase Bud32 [Candidatus Nanoarchaeia archaeon]|nr:KEOPS complex kinase/ATPase Bud32 [Candidatus Nanoarchaeia archaeon]
MQQIAQGAEAILYVDDAKVIKHRSAKAYRHPELDKQLRTLRTRREAKILETLQKLKFPSPKLLKSDEKTATLELELIPGIIVRTALSTLTKSQKEQLMKMIGKLIAQLHQNNLIHGDLTTSNMILNLKDKKQPLHFIDFGLSYTSLRVEDKAVDLHVLERAFESTHHELYPDLFNLIIIEYQKHYTDGAEVLKRLEKVKERGRYKLKNGS